MMPAEAVIAEGRISSPLPYFPPRLTALAHVPSWQLLETRHQLRYSQLYALYLNEQTVFFEELLATNVLPALYHRPDRIGESLAADLRRFEMEERKHSGWFRALNHRIDPCRFRLDEGSYVFVPANSKMQAMTAWFARRPFAFPCWIWLMLLQEERSISVARECIREGNRLDPEFLELHRRHMADEVDHVRWDLQLVERVWMPLPMWKRRLQAKIFAAMMGEFFTAPKRAAKAVLQCLLDEFPDLAPLGPVLHQELRQLTFSREYHSSLYSREMTPRCFALFDELPEFRNVGHHLLAYERP